MKNKNGQAHIRDFGDGRTIVVYTEDDGLRNQLERLDGCQLVVPYQFGSRTVGADLYFPKEARREIRTLLGA